MSTGSKSTTSCSEDDNELRRGPWTIEEDTLLIHYIAHHGEGRWNLLAKRSGNQKTYLQVGGRKLHSTYLGGRTMKSRTIGGQEFRNKLSILRLTAKAQHFKTSLEICPPPQISVQGDHLNADGHINGLNIQEQISDWENCTISCIDSSESMNHNTLGKSCSNVNNGSSIDIYKDASLSASGMFENPAGDYHVEHNSWNDRDFLGWPTMAYLHADMCNILYRGKETTMASKSSTPPYPSAARISDSPCYPQYSASLKCLEEYQSDKSKCQEHFDIYKECKKKEMLLNGVIPDNYTVPYVLKACVQSHSLKEGLQIHANSIKTVLLFSNVHVKNTLMRLYAVCGLVDAVEALFAEPCLVVEAQSILRTWNLCTDLSLKWNTMAAWSTFKAVQDGLKPQVEHYGCLGSPFGSL
ncbi:hypothetical protein FEM48_Zijuj06G0204900 [Ziziphus jujuba var. spinosa]|uniref:Uncharacterized protein n=1 Tax=Ziziphus jujuba var. spinosa TaxID=714518 RepID=A0A978VBG3_ZIZJJ|nr:hypothetical protein FEM48_Zijuj06G0204900 [Ziziphus jujuba var. spinosa]